MNIKDIITDKYYYISDGGKIHFYYDGDDNGYYLCGSNYSGVDNISVFYIPNTINGKPVIGIDGDVFVDSDELKIFIIEPDNQFFSIYEGGLCSKDMKKMYHTPPMYPEKTFRVPDGVTEIMDSAIRGNIETLVLSPECEKIREYGVSVLKNLKEIYIPKSLTFIGFKAFTGTIPQKVLYEGTEKDREKIDFTDESFNKGIIEAVWCYECEMPKHRSKKE